MALGRHCALVVLRSSTAVQGRRVANGALVGRQSMRGVASSASVSVPVHRRALTTTAALAGIGMTAAAVSLLLLAADGSLGDAVEADDGRPPADGLSPAPTPAALGSSSSSSSGANQPTSAVQHASYTHATADSAADEPPDAPYPASATALAAGANQASTAASSSGKPHLVILGSGWGAVSLLKGLDRDAYEVTVISPRNYFLFTPLLPSATTGQVESRTLMEPIRRICHRISAHYFEGKVSHAHTIAHTLDGAVTSAARPCSH